MTPAVNDTSLDSYYTGAQPSPRVQQRHPAPHSCLPSPRTSSLTLNLKSTLPAMDHKFSSANTSAALKPSPLSPKDPNVFIDDFSDSFDDDFDQIDNDCYIVSNENMPPMARASNDVSCIAVFRAGAENSQLTVKDTRAVEKESPAGSPPIDSEGWRLPFANRKRIIDEMYEDCGRDREVNTPPPAKKCSSIHSVASEKQTQSVMGIDGDLQENDWQVKASVSKPSMRSNQTRLKNNDSQSRGSCSFPSLSYGLERKCHENTKDGKQSLARKLALKSGSAESSLAPPSQQTRKLATLSCRSEEEQLSLVQNGCTFSAPSTCEQTTESLPKPSQCSFFTAQPTRLVETSY